MVWVMVWGYMGYKGLGYKGRGYKGYKGYWGLGRFM